MRFDLDPFIIEWGATQTRFIAAITRELSDMLPVRSQDFSISPSTELGDSRCKYRIFGGPGTIVLNPDSLQLNFANLNENDYPVVIEITRRSLDLLLKDIGSYTGNRVSLTFYHHVRTVKSGDADVYLDQFTLKQPADTAKTELEIEYRPSVKIILSDKDKHWVLHRSVEKSELLPDSLFVSTNIFISSPDVKPFDEQRRLVERIYDLANQVVGLEYPLGSADDTTS